MRGLLRMRMLVEELPQGASVHRRGQQSVPLALIIPAFAIGCGLAVQLLANAARPGPDEMARYDFESCAQARAVFAAPLKRGEPWYRAELDRDGDGIACELYRSAGARYVASAAWHTVRARLGAHMP
ncbi:MAG: excalibur calcium-binding domain-containing protein [Ignavibacteriales bacterium]